MSRIIVHYSHVLCAAIETCFKSCLPRVHLWQITLLKGYTHPNEQHVTACGIYTINALAFRCILVILHVLRMRRNVNRNVYNAGKCKRYTGTGPALRQYIVPVLGQCWTSTGPIQHAGTGPVPDRYIAPVLAQYWASIGPVPHASIGPIHSRCAAHVLGQYRLYRPGTGPVQSC